MAEYQVTYWRDLPSMVAARDGAGESKVPLPQRFMEAIDEAAMRLGETSSDDYLAGWRRGDWTESGGTPGEVADRVAAELDDEWPEERLGSYLDEIGPAAE
jgi:Virulence factor